MQLTSKFGRFLASINTHMLSVILTEPIALCCNLLISTSVTLNGILNIAGSEQSSCQGVNDILSQNTHAETAYRCFE